MSKPRMARLTLSSLTGTSSGASPSLQRKRAAAQYSYNRPPASCQAIERRDGARANRKDFEIEAERNAAVSAAVPKLLIAALACVKHLAR
jgi:hypothetical protein